MRGRKPKPSEVKRREGNPGKRPLSTRLTAGRSRPVMPRGFTDREKTIWRLVVEDLERGGVLDKADWPVVEVFTTTLALHREARADVRKLGRYAEGQKGAQIIAPWTKLAQDTGRDIVRLAEQLGLSPVGRARLGIAGDAGKSMEDEFDDEVGASPRLRALEGGRP